MPSATAWPLAQLRGDPYADLLLKAELPDGLPDHDHLAGYVFTQAGMARFIGRHTDSMWAEPSYKPMAIS